MTSSGSSHATRLRWAASILKDAPRVAFIRASDGLGSQNAIVWEVALWEDAIGVRADGGEIYLVYHVPNEAIVIPETIDAIRAMTGLEADAARSIEKTDVSLGIRRRFLRSGASVSVGVG